MPIWPYPWQKVTDPLAIVAGAMRNPIQIQASVATQDGYGQPIGVAGSGPIVLSCFAFIETVTVREMFQEGFVSQVVHKIVIRWPGDSVQITANQVVISGNNVYQIQDVENVQQRNRKLILTCLEIDSAKVSS